MQKPLRLGLALVTAAGLAAPAASAQTAPRPKPVPRPVQVQLLGLNDFHGNLAPPAGGSGTIAPAPGVPPVPAGGAEYLATHLRRLEAANRNTLVVSAGDLIGASPLLSALFHDEPTIEAMNQIGLDINAVGNHEFDEGAAELKRMQRGGCHPTDGCKAGHEFEGADFRFLAANVVDQRTRRTLFPPFDIRRFSGIDIGFIGMTLEGTPEIVTPSGVAGLDFLDEAETANRYARLLRERYGVRAIVVLLHEGGAQSGGIDECAGISGPIADIVRRTSRDIDLFITGHTHQAYRCVIDGRPVTSASSFGRLVTDIDLTLNRRTRDVARVQADNVVVSRDVAKAPDITALIQGYDALAAPLRDRVIGSITADVTRTQNAAGESALGDVIADAQLAATRGAGTGGAQAAFMNPGGVRADLVFAPSSGELPGQVTYGEAFTVQPFGNSLVTVTLTGAQIDALLEQQWCGQPAPKVLQPSAGFAYAWDAAAPACDRVDSITLDGAPVSPAASYRVTVNSFLADGGDGFAVLRQGANRLGGAVDVDALEAYFKASSPVAPGPQNRIARRN